MKENRVRLVKRKTGVGLTFETVKTEQTENGNGVKNGNGKRGQKRERNGVKRGQNGVRLDILTFDIFVDVTF